MNLEMLTIHKSEFFIITPVVPLARKVESSEISYFFIFSLNRAKSNWL